MVKAKDHRKVSMEGCWLWLPMPWPRYSDTGFLSNSRISHLLNSVTDY